MYNWHMLTYDQLARAAPRLWSKVRKSRGCWLWTGPRCGLNSTYGQAYIAGRRTTAHRIFYQITHGPIGDGIWVLHKCDAPLCCRSSHLFLGTPKDNTQDMLRKGRRKYPTRGLYRGKPSKLTREKVLFARRWYARRGMYRVWGEGSM